MIESIVKLRGCVSIVKHYQDSSDTCRCEENGNILFAIASHDSYAISLVNAHGQKTTS
jgi:hypothetical protein